MVSLFFWYVGFVNKNEGNYHKKNKEALDSLFQMYTVYELLFRVDVLAKLIIPILNQLRMHIGLIRFYNKVVSKTFVNDYYLKENHKHYNKEYFLKNLKNLEESYVFLKNEMGFKTNDHIEIIYKKYKNQEST